MTTNALMYGPMQRPDRKKSIEARQSLLGVALAAYSSWKPLADQAKIPFAPLQENDEAFPEIDELYSEAAALIRPYSSLFSNVTLKDVLELNSAVKHDTASGIFYSALLNETELPFLIGEMHHGTIGYKLAQNKLLVALPGSDVTSFAPLASGGLAVLYGSAAWMASAATGGVQVNSGHEWRVIPDFALPRAVRERLFPPLGKVYQPVPLGGAQIHLRALENIDFGFSGGGQTLILVREQPYERIFQNVMSRYFTECYLSCTDIVLAKNFHYGESVRKWHAYGLWEASLLPEAAEAKLSELERQIRTELNTAEQLFSLGTDLPEAEACETAVRAAISYDWNNFEQRINQQVSQMREMAR